MLPFDKTTYLNEVLGKYAETPDLPGLFERYCLALDATDDAAITQRLKDVANVWNKNAGHSKYGDLVTRLRGGHTQARLTLEDPTARATAAAEAASDDARRTAAAERARKAWERTVTETVRKHGALTAPLRARLQRAGVIAGLDSAAVARRLDAAPVAVIVEPLDAVQRRQIREALNGLAQKLREPRRRMTLFHALDPDVGIADRATVRARHAELADTHGELPHGELKNLWGNVLTQVKLHLLDSPPDAYLASLLEEVKEMLYQDALDAANRGGGHSIDVAEADDLIRLGIKHGLTQSLAERAVVELAAEQGAGVRTGELVDYVCCRVCNTPHARPYAPAACIRCGVDLFLTCAECGHRCDATASRCPGCQTATGRSTAARQFEIRVPEVRLPLLAVSPNRHAVVPALPTFAPQIGAPRRFAVRWPAVPAFAPPAPPRLRVPPIPRLPSLGRRPPGSSS